MTGVVLDLDCEVPARTQAILSSLPGVSVRVAKGQSQLRVGDDTYPLALISGGLRPFSSVTALMLTSLAGQGKLGLVVADHLPVHARRALEDAGCAYADGTGAAHIDVPGLFLHIEGKPSRRAVISPPAGIGITAVRVIQALLTASTQIWSVSDLAREAVCSRGEAHRVMTRLEREGLLTSQGRARSLRRAVADPGQLLDWLSTVPSARRIRERQHAFVYSADPAKLVAAISRRGNESGLEYAFTGVAAAHILGVAVTTAVPVTTVRVAPDVPLLDACSLLDAEPVDSGANVALIRDLGMVGVHGRMSNGPAQVAPLARIWLDMLGEPRGEDAAALFREALIGW